MIPILFTHRGDQNYVKVAIQQARQWNENVILLGDESNADWDVEHYHIANYFQKDAHADYYEHMCSNPHDFELYNLQEPFVLREFMRQQWHTRIFACDSDVMIYADMTEEEKRLDEYIAAYSIPKHQPDYRWSASAHSAYWTFGGLDMFCEFIEETYRGPRLEKLREKWRWHQEKGAPGGVCDMTLLWLFYKEWPHLIKDVCAVRGGVAFDHNIRVSENTLPGEYRMDGEIKQVAWENGQPYCHSLALGQPVRFATLHFQDGAKPLMKDYYRERP